MFSFNMNEETYNPADLQKEATRPKVQLKSVNEQKLEILKKYEIIFSGINIDTMTIAPTLLAKSVFFSRLEQCYDKQFEHLMKVKSKQVLDLPKTIHKTFKQGSSSNLNFLTQSLGNLMYSADKYAETPEVELFLRFVLAKPPSLQYLFYLYVRQHFKIITYTNFISHKKTEQDPSKVCTTYKIAESILKQAFYSDNIAHKKLTKALADNFNKKDQIYYYDFLSKMCAVDLNYRDLEMMEHLIALYTIKSREELRGKSTTQQQEDGNENVFNMYDDEDDDFISKSGMEYTENGGLVKTELKTEIETIHVHTERVVQNAMDRSINSKSPRVMVKNAGPPQNVINLADLDIHEQLVIKKNLQRDKKDKTLQNLIKSELKSYVNKLIINFIKQNQISIDDLGDRSQNANKQIYNKLFYLITSIFINDRAKFFRLMRKDLDNDEDTLQFWNSLHNAYDSLKDLETSSPSIAKDFLNRLFENAIISEEIMFFLNFYFKNDQDIVNYTVVVELEQAE